MTGEFGQGCGDVGGVRRRLESRHGRRRDFKAEIKPEKPVRTWKGCGMQAPSNQNHGAKLQHVQQILWGKY